MTTKEKNYFEKVLKDIENYGSAITKTEIELNKKGEPQIRISRIPFDDFYIKPKNHDKILHNTRSSKFVT